jgi:hypothetical protein
LSVSVVPECLPLAVEYAALPEEELSFFSSVREEEQSVALVRRAHVGRTETSPFDIEPDGGKVGKHVGEPKRKVSSDVLTEQERRVALLKDSIDLGPEVALVVVSAAVAGDGEGLTGIPRNDEIHRATPASASEGSEIVEDRSLIQRRLRHPFHEAGCGESVPLDQAHTSCPRAKGKLESSQASTESDGT